jgi:hypothetical protein
MGQTVTGERGCYSGPTAYRAPGYLEGADFVYGGWPMGVEGREGVFDFATMERSKFAYRGAQIGSFVAFVGGSIYWGTISGFPFGDSRDIVDAYSGYFVTVSKGFSVGEGGSIGAGRNYFFSPTDLALYGRSTYIGASFGANIVLDLGAAVTYYFQDSSVTSYASNGHVRRGELINDIWRGAGSPFSYWKEVLASHGISITRPLPNEYISIQRGYAVLLANWYADAYEAMWQINHP